MRNWFERLKAYLRFRFLLTASNPRNFEEFWSLQLSRSQFFSAILALLIIGGFLVSIVFGGLLSGDTFGGLSNEERSELTQMKSKLDIMTTKTKQQELYLVQLRKVLSGDVSADSLKEIPEAQLIDPKTIDTSRTASERQLAVKVGKQLGSTESVYRLESPINGVTVKEKYSRSHPYVKLLPKKSGWLYAFAEGIVLVGKESNSSRLVISYDGGIVVIFRNLDRVEISEGTRTRIGEIMAHCKKGSAVTLEIRKGETAVNPAEVFDFGEE